MLDKKKNRYFMELAIEEMKKSKSEHGNKLDPLVGAVLVDENGKIMGKANRGNLRSGDHAEYTLIERKLGNKVLENTSLYVTLEPCTVRNPPKVPCAKRIVSARINSVFIGITDPNPDIEGKGISFLHQNNINVYFFDSDLSQLIRQENKEFIEQFQDDVRTTNITNEIVDEPSRKENELVRSASFNDFSSDVIEKYLKLCERNYKLSSKELKDFFYKLGFLNYDESEKRYIPTVAGILLFGKHPEDFLPQSIIKIQVKYGLKPVLQDIEGSLLTIPEKTLSFLKKNMKTYSNISGLERIELPEYPIEALREAIVNAIVHRDYEEGRRIFITLSMDRIEIRSPGLAMLPLTLEKIKRYNTSPFNRNPRIAYAFSKMKMMEERGLGLKLMHDILIKNDLQPPIFNFENDYFVVTFLSPIGSSDEFHIPKDILEKLNDRQVKAISLINERVKITSNEYAKEFEINKKTAIRDLNKLIDLEIVKSGGRGTRIYYILRKN
ncbi:MAG: hypothetical protein HWN81_21080 [Candidatus Lokiarchaeota archaeon]|nr:hypothetical protein [Candidatus Lokiarchaeota archaeon]